jgi:hypothetical protein
MYEKLKNFQAQVSSGSTPSSFHTRFEFLKRKKKREKCLGRLEKWNKRLESLINSACKTRISKFETTTNEAARTVKDAFHHAVKLLEMPLPHSTRGKVLPCELWKHRERLDRTWNTFRLSCFVTLLPGKLEMARGHSHDKIVRVRDLPLATMD